MSDQDSLANLTAAATNNLMLNALLAAVAAQVALGTPGPIVIDGAALAQQIKSVVATIPASAGIKQSP